MDDYVPLRARNFRKMLETQGSFVLLTKLKTSLRKAESNHKYPEIYKLYPRELSYESRTGRGCRPSLGRDSRYWPPSLFFCKDCRIN